MTAPNPSRHRFSLNAIGDALQRSDHVLLRRRDVVKCGCGEKALSMQRESAYLHPHEEGMKTARLRGGALVSVRMVLQCFLETFSSFAGIGRANRYP